MSPTGADRRGARLRRWLVAFAGWSTLACGLALSGGGCRAKGVASADASADARDGAVELDANLPETVVIVLEAGAEPNRPAPRASATSRYVTLLSGLPTPCQDTSKRLGIVSFAQSGDDIVITSSKTKARARCAAVDPGKLLCDWVGMDGKPSVEQKLVTYGPKKPIGGAFDKTHSFSCKPQ